MIITAISIHVHHHVPSIPVLNIKSVHNCLIPCTNMSVEVTDYLPLSFGYILCLAHPSTSMHGTSMEVSMMEQL